MDFDGQPLCLPYADEAENASVGEAVYHGVIARNAVHDWHRLELSICEVEELSRGGQTYHAESVILMQTLKADSLAGWQEEECAKAEARGTFFGPERPVEERRGVVSDQASFPQGGQGVRGVFHYFFVCWEVLDDHLAEEAYSGKPGEGLEVKVVQC